jgi:hypothetical protein
MNTVRLVAFLIAIGLSVGFGYSLGESAGRKASNAGDGVSQYQFEQMARQFSRTVYEQHVSAAGADAAPAAGPERQAPARPPQRAKSFGDELGGHE